MTELEVSKLEIAREYLDAAIEFFLEQTKFFCAIHLAGAAEELFGAHLPESERIHTLAWKAEKALMSETGLTPSDAAARRSVNKWKNEVKHMDDGTPGTVTIDPEFMAEQYIKQALINFDKLNLPKSAKVRKFEDHQNRKSPGWRMNVRMMRSPLFALFMVALATPALAQQPLDRPAFVCADQQAADTAAALARLRDRESLAIHSRSYGCAMVLPPDDFTAGERRDRPRLRRRPEAK